jgi:hypothetical protein
LPENRGQPGIPVHALKHFEIVRRDSNSPCAAALKRRMRVIVDDVSTSYLMVGTPELDLMREVGVAAVYSTPLIRRGAEPRQCLGTIPLRRANPSQQRPTRRIAGRKRFFQTFVNLLLGRRGI